MMERIKRIARSFWLGVVVPGFAALTMASCTAPHHPVYDYDTGNESHHGWPEAHDVWHQTTSLPPGWELGREFWHPTLYDPLKVPIPGIEGARVVGQDVFCAECHSTYVKSFASNVHHNINCEQCHGAASVHLETRGRQPDTILSLAKPEIGNISGRPLSPAARSEICLRCHEQNANGTATPCIPGMDWRTSSHAHKEVACTDCHNVHYLVPPGTPPADEIAMDGPHRRSQFRLATAEMPVANNARSGQMRQPGQTRTGMSRLPPVREAAFTSDAGRRPVDDESRRALSRKLGAVSPENCYQCHGEMRRLEELPHPHQLGVARVFHGRTVEFNCTTCHDAHGNVTAATRKELCLDCHQDVHAQEWSGSPHDVAGVACTDCHNPHPSVGPPMAVDQPGACYRCHSQMSQLEQIAHPHQILGPNGFICTTCHRPHGRIDSTTRTDTCLQCHKGSPTMAWHSSIHHREGVACADCHNAHPEANSPRFLSVSHTAVDRRKRLPMCVDEPGVCYECHPGIYGKTSMPSHHPIREGKMVCSDCHDGHGQGRENLKADSMNDLCCECHAEKEGPFVWEHPPVTEDCGHCHDPHGTVTNNLLHQPTTFLCLRCHTGHSTHDLSFNLCSRCHPAGPPAINMGGGPRPTPDATTPTIRAAMFTDCTQCHTQIHGTDLTRGFECGGHMRR